ncbi:hypothetical protein GC197_10000 [bacterium]|nr:hypothetical protein [bacterium]
MIFVVQSLPRCGTHLLRTALMSHGEITCFGEVFNPHSRMHGFSVEHPTIHEVFNHCQECSAPTGFVAHAYVGLSDDETGPGLDQTFRRRKEVQAARGLWMTIPPNTPVITLRRENLLERYVSLLVAEQRQNWLVCRGQSMPSPVTVRIDCGKMFADFTQIETLIDIARQRFPDAIHASYEQLVDDAEATFLRIQEHLGVEARCLTPHTLKVGRSLQETIFNLNEVRTALGGTRYETFLEHTR